MASEQMVNEALHHFGITDKEANAGLWVSENTENSRKLLGIESDLNFNGKEIKRARIVIDYDASYPLIIKRVIKAFYAQQENQETSLELDLQENQLQCREQQLSEEAILRLCEDEESALSISRERVLQTGEYGKQVNISKQYE